MRCGRSARAGPDSELGASRLAPSSTPTPSRSETRGQRAAPRQRDPAVRLGLLRGRARRPAAEVTRYIDAHRDRFGVEPICRVLQVAPSSYYAAKRRQPSARALRDAELGPKVLRAWKENYQVYGARKVWKQLRREGVAVGRDRGARLMRSLGIAGAVRGKPRRTTVADPAATRAPDLVQRQFTATRPNRLWVSDFTYVATWSGTVYVAFVIDVFSRLIVGWRAAASMRTELVLDALEMAIWRRASVLDGLVCHSDAGGQGEFNWSSQHLDSEGLRWEQGSAEQLIVPVVLRCVRR